jgi:ankyrin repeat protein
VLALLLEANADPSAARTTDGQTPVFIAAVQGHLDVVALLLKANADPSTARMDGATPLQFAQQQGHTTTMRLLTQHLYAI